MKTKRPREERDPPGLPATPDPDSDPDPEHALVELQAEQPAVGDAQGGAGRFGQVRGQHVFSAVPPPRAAPKLTDVVEASSCTEQNNWVRTDGPGKLPPASQVSGSFTDPCPGLPPRRCWLRWGRRRKRRTSWSGCRGSDHPEAST